MRSLILVLSLAILVAVEARIGETPIQFADRYGRPKDSSLTKITDNASPLVQGAIDHTYEYRGWKIRAAFFQLDSPAIRMDFQKLGGPGVSPADYELQAIAAANTPPGMSWKRIAYDNPDSSNKGLAKLAEGFIGGATGQKMWQRTDGAILWLRSNLVVRLELAAACEYEAQLKISKEQKARASVPKF
ncbi:MAG: hypothetical protein H0U99_07650 [Chthoniobacterales bacterium]|nr:hypothetical protein [Chthoniobacterales bacterium]